jgi:ankyrin repeat protein
MTAHHHAIARRNAALVRLLLEGGAKPLARDLDGKSPFSLANAEIADSLRASIMQLADVEAAQ